MGRRVLFSTLEQIILQYDEFLHFWIRAANNNSNFILYIAPPNFKFDQPGQKESVPPADPFEPGFNLLIQGSLHESALFFKKYELAE